MERVKLQYPRRDPGSSFSSLLSLSSNNAFIQLATVKYLPTS